MIKKLKMLLAWAGVWIAKSSPRINSGRGAFFIVRSTIITLLWKEIPRLILKYL